MALRQNTVTTAASADRPTADAAEVNHDRDQPLRPGIVATENDVLPEDLERKEIETLHDLQSFAWSGLASNLNAELERELQYFQKESSTEDTVFLTLALANWRRQWEGDVVQGCSFAASMLYTAGLREMDDPISQESRRQRAIYKATARMCAKAVSQ